jgi:exonuclease III
MGRNTGFSSSMRQFMERVGLLSVWEHHPVNYTHMHTDMVSTSTIDHFLVNERLLSVIVDAGVLHLGDNLSRHIPIMMKLDLGQLPLQKRVKTSVPR